MALPRRVIVTGAAQGIGRAVALHLASPGVALAVWDVKRDGVEETAKLCHERGAAARGWTVDVGDADAIEAAVAAFERTWGKPDGLVNNAGIFPRARALDMKLAEWEEVLRVNLTGTFVTARTVAARMKDLGRGAIVNTASGRALAGAANGAHYAASKGGIIALTKSLALDWAAYGIRVNCVIPGLTDTAQPRVEMGDNELYAAGASIPMGRIGRPEDIAAVVAFLLSDDAGYMTGQSVAANGGAIMVP
ncbi:MAG: SDR family oxidoreductase [Hyphomicrobiales bacterium]|jgi:NAD(P)-dependent dehydrogenase (short-subunit alcohol dehydrogenase family)|nr:SDR family oxidoreductase [Hyphomicrobiales bacterium]MBV8418987.1 SDR family oxidoreductase [Hyphomicrobiales bacterium]